MIRVPSLHALTAEETNRDAEEANPDGDNPQQPTATSRAPPVDPVQSPARPRTVVVEPLA